MKTLINGGLRSHVATHAMVVIVASGCAQDRAARPEQSQAPEEVVFERRGRLADEKHERDEKQRKRDEEWRRRRAGLPDLKPAQAFRDEAGLPAEVVLAFSDYGESTLLLTEQTFVLRKTGSGTGVEWIKRPVSELRSAELVRQHFDPKLVLMFSDTATIGIPLLRPSLKQWVVGVERAFGLPPRLRPLARSDYQHYVLDPLEAAAERGALKRVDHLLAEAEAELVGRSDPSDRSLQADLAAQKKKYAAWRLDALTRGGKTDGLDETRRWGPGWSDHHPTQRLGSLLERSSEANTLLQAVAPVGVEVEVNGRPRDAIARQAEVALREQLRLPPARPRTTARVRLTSQGEGQKSEATGNMPVWTFECSVVFVRDGEVVFQRETTTHLLGITPQRTMDAGSSRRSPIRALVHEALAIYMLDQLEKLHTPAQ